MTKAQQDDGRHRGRKRSTFTEEDDGKPLTEELLRWWIGRKPKKVRNIWDGDGLFIRITPRGKMSWKLEYTVRNASDPTDNKRGKMTLGPYTQKHSLEWARVEARRNKDLANDGINPYKVQKEAIEQDKLKNKTFEEVSDLWFEDQINRSAKDVKTKSNIKSRLKNHLYLSIGNIRYKDITSDILSRVIKKIYDDQKKKSVLTKKLIEDLNRIGRWAKGQQYSDINPAENLAEECKEMNVDKDHHAAIILPKKVGEFLNRLDNYKQKEEKDVVQNALTFITYIPLRTAELRDAKIKELDFDSNVWIIPKDRSKTRKEFIVPLTTKAAELLKRQIQSNAKKGNDDYIFQKNGTRIGINALHQRLRNMGYNKGEATVHGLRATFSTLMRSSGLSKEEFIEKNLSHSYGSEPAKSYIRDPFVEQRRQCFEDYGYILDGLKAGKDFNELVKELKRKHFEEDR